MNNSKINLNQISEKYSIVKYLNKYNLYIEEEDEEYFTLTNNEKGVSEIESENIDFFLNYETLGFVKKERNTYVIDVKKDDSNIKGNWKRLIKYKNWNLRVIDEKNDSFLLLALGDYALEDLKFKQIEGSFYSIKWVNKNLINLK